MVEQGIVTESQIDLVEGDESLIGHGVGDSQTAKLLLSQVMMTIDVAGSLWRDGFLHDRSVQSHGAKRDHRLAYNASAGQAGQSRCGFTSRKVRTPPGGITANGRRVPDMAT